MNQVRITRCGTTVSAIGRVFDPHDWVDVRVITDPHTLVEHQFDGFGLVEAANDDTTGASPVA